MVRYLAKMMERKRVAKKEQQMGFGLELNLAQRS